MVIALEVAEDADHLTLHSEDLDIRSITVAPIKRGKTKKAKDAAFTVSATTVEVRPKKGFRSGAATLTIDFDGDIRTDTSGLYVSRHQDVPYLSTQFEADDARTAFPCFDEPAFKIPWTVQITAPDDQTVLANMPVASRLETEGGATYVHETSPPLPSYLVAFAVGPWDSTEVTGVSVPITVYSPAGTAPSTAEVVRQIPEHLTMLEEWFGRDVPYPKMDFVVVPDFAYGGMENPGLIVLSRWLLEDPDAPDPQSVPRIAEVVGHELAHQWFGNHVTPAWWDDLWLNESFASWMGLKSREAVMPGHPATLERVQRTYSAIRADGRETMRPLRTDVDPSNVFASANFLAYPKGQAILSSTERWIGTDAFQAGLREYMDAHADANATAADLFEALSTDDGNGMGTDVGAMLAPYLDRPGAPLLTFSRTESGFDVRQTRYAALGAALEPLEAGEEWTIPLVVRTPDGTERAWMEDASASIEVGDVAWMLPVSDGVGYFAWTFEDRDDLAALIDAFPYLSPAEQVAVVSNLRTLVTGGVLEAGEVLEIYGAVEPDSNVVVRESVLAGLSALEGSVPPELEEAYGAWLLETLGPWLDELGLEADGGAEEAGVLELRRDLVALLGDHGDPRVEAHWEAMAEALLDDPDSVDRRIAGAALSRVAEDRDRAFQDDMLARFEAADDPRMQSIWLSAFAHVETEEAEQAALTWAIESADNAGQLFTVVGGVFDDEEDSEAQLDWLIAHHDAVTALVPSQFHGRFVGWGVGCDEALLERSKAFYLAPERTSPQAERIANETAESVRACTLAREHHAPSLRRVLVP